ncbi:MAG: ATP phosphoribosyltransferase regulatory subunit, partial [Microcella sp.]
VPLAFDPFLVRGMGYYTGPIFEVAHPGLGYSLGGGGRYDGMIGRFAGTDVAACGFSLGFERLVDLVSSEQDARGGSALIVDKDVAPADTITLKRALVAGGERVRVVTRTKNMRALLEQLERDGFARFASVRAGEADVAALQWRALGE